MADSFLVDAGFLVALANEQDRFHAPCVAIWRRFGPPSSLITTEGAIVEALHLLRRVRGGPEATIGLIIQAHANVVGPDARRYVRAIELMDRYANVPMDFVDALLVAIAEETGVLDVLTLDRRGFETYRVGRRSFRILP